MHNWQLWFSAFFCRWLLLSLAWIILNFAPSILLLLPATPVNSSLIEHFSSALYKPFALWFLDYYWLAFSLAGPLYFYEQRGRFLLTNDKYQAAVVFLFQPVLRHWGIKKKWSPLVRLGLLAFLLKLFFLPYVVSWCFQNIQSLWITVQSLSWDFRALTRVLIQFCLFIDVAMFGLGYLIESRRLRSEIRSVDPSWFGWLVCLWCYPPFNSSSFAVFDVALFSIQLETSEFVKLFFNGIEVVLWAIFAWASLALGFKASNLTARGVVCRGPYHWIRHPAYTAKLGVWWIQGIIFGEYTVGILLAFTLAYSLRAWTEERHLLLADNDYAKYAQKVRWRFFPGIL